MQKCNGLRGAADIQTKAAFDEADTRNKRLQCFVCAVAVGSDADQVWNEFASSFRSEMRSILTQIGKPGHKFSQCKSGPNDDRDKV